MPDLYLICITAAFLASEFLPFVRDIKANGLVHAVQLLALHAVQACSPEPAVVTQPIRRVSAPPTPSIHTQSVDVVRHARKRRKVRRLPSPLAGSAGPKGKIRSADAISKRHRGSLRHKAQEHDLEPPHFCLDVEPNDMPEPQSMLGNEPIAIEITPMVHTTI
jgi:hypothetical protein